MNDNTKHRHRSCSNSLRGKAPPIFLETQRFNFMRNHLVVAVLLFSLSGWAQRQPNAKVEGIIDALFEHQIKAWNEGDVDDFMLGYWNDERLIFVGSTGPTYG